ncbi:MAG: ATP-dependent DNA helicase [Candidatus Pacearchaeota archaeon]
MILSKEKQQIIKDDTHNIKVVAGPGSGKTTLIIEKVYELVKKGVSPNKILIITYTNKAAEDIERKISKRIKEKGFYVSTFHGFCVRFMREYPDFFKDYKGFKVLDDLGQLLFIIKWDKLIKTDDTEKIESLKLRNYFGRVKDNYSKEDFKKIEHPIKESYFNYCDKLYEQKKMDFGDLINIVHDTINQNINLHKIAQEKFDYIFVDEYQDINKNQEKLLKLFLKPSTKLMVVGDKNQSIYGFRGSDLRIFESFENSFNNTKSYYLTKNYRSTWKIINLTNKYMVLSDQTKIIGNTDKDDGKLTEEGNKITIKKYPDKDKEALETILQIKKWKETNKIKNFSDVAILLRSVKGDSKRFIEIMDKYNIPYEVIGDGGLFELSYIRAILDCYKQLAEKGEKDKIINENLGINIDRSDISDSIKKGPLAIFYKIIENSKYLQDAIIHNKEEILTNLGKFSQIISTYCEIFNFDRKGDYLLTFFNNLSKINTELLDTEQPTTQFNNSVKILTLHKSKGLEFPLVIIPGINKENYKVSSKDFISELFGYYSPKEDLKRAFYVAMTRAKQKLILSYYGNPAEYIKDLVGQKEFVFYEKYNQSRLFSETLEEIDIEPSSPEKEVLELTYYKLLEFWKCPFAYKLRFYNNLQLPKRFAFTYGSILHSLLYYLNSAIKNNEKYDINLLIRKNVPKYLLDHFNFKFLLKNYLRVFKDEIRNIIAIEKPVEFSLSESVIKGRIDLIVKTKQGEYAIVEFKSGDWEHLKEEYAKKQVNLYAISQSDYNITKGIIYFFGSGGKRIDFKIDKKQTELDIVETISKIRKFIERCEFDKNTKSCNSCIFKEYLICPYRSKEVSYSSRDYDEEDDEYKDEFNEI